MAGRKIHKLKRLTEVSYQVISSLLQEALEELENKGLDNTVEYDQIDKAQEEVNALYW